MNWYFELTNYRNSDPVRNKDISHGTFTESDFWHNLETGANGCNTLGVGILYDLQNIHQENMSM